MSVCTGARTLAQLGLLDGRDATTNTLLLADYERSFPKVRWTSLFDYSIGIIFSVAKYLH